MSSSVSAMVRRQGLTCGGVASGSDEQVKSAHGAFVRTAQCRPFDPTKFDCSDTRLSLQKTALKTPKRCHPSDCLQSPG